MFKLSHISSARIPNLNSFEFKMIIVDFSLMWVFELLKNRLISSTVVYSPFIFASPYIKSGVEGTFMNLVLFTLKNYFTLAILM